MSNSGLARKQTIPKGLSGIVYGRSRVVPEAEEHWPHVGFRNVPSGTDDSGRWMVVGVLPTH